MNTYELILIFYLLRIFYYSQFRKLEGENMPLKRTQIIFHQLGQENFEFIIETQF